jgi:hypothetical protein
MKFKDDFREKSGNDFQDFFSDIMEKCYPGDFQRIRPWGNVGDKKNDGYLRSERTIFQVYGPNEMEAKETIAKIEADFYGALKHWADHMDKWVFVHNSKKGLGPDVFDKLCKLDAAHNLVSVCAWGYEELYQHVFTLNEADLLSLLGPVPSSKTMIDVRYENVQEVLNNIARQELPSSLDIRPVPPGKLKFNHLSENIQILLTSGMWKADLVGNFFRDHVDPLYGDQIASAFSKEYKKLRSWSADPDLMFRKLQQFTGGQNRENPDYEAAVLAVLAYFFEQCDIFERPPAEVVS